MDAILQSLLPNMSQKWPELWQSTLETLYMVSVSSIFSLVIGLFFGVLLVVTKPGGILQNTLVYNLLDKVINIFRSIPFVIMIAMLLPVTRFVVGTAIGTKGAILPLVVGTVPFFARQVESALADVNPGLIEAAQSMGTGPAGLIFRVYLRESIPGLVRAVSITFVSLVGLTALAGAVGGGGLGDFAIRYGHQRRQTDVTYVTVLVVLLLISVVQAISGVIVRKTSHNGGEEKKQSLLFAALRPQARLYVLSDEAEK